MVVMMVVIVGSGHGDEGSGRVVVSGKSPGVGGIAGAADARTFLNIRAN